MDPSAIVYEYHNRKIVPKKVKKLKIGDNVMVVGKDFNVRTAIVNNIQLLEVPSSLISRITFKNGFSLIKADNLDLCKLYDIPKVENDQYSGTFMTFKNNNVGMTEIDLIEYLESKTLVRMIAVTCSDTGLVVNGVGVMT